MKKRTKWILVAIGTAVATPILAIVVIFLSVCSKPTIEPTPEAYLHAKQIWSGESGNAKIDIQVDSVVAKINVSSGPLGSATIQYPDEGYPRDVFQNVMYFGPSNLKFDEENHIIYIEVSGSNPACGCRQSGTRIFEYDAERRLPVRDYWVGFSK